MEYRTEEQFKEICESALNGNWTQAGEEAEEYGFYANDLIKFWDSEDYHILEDKGDLAIICEIAQKIRGEEWIVWNYLIRYFLMQYLKDIS